MGELTREMLDRREDILNWMESVRPPGGDRPVLFSELQEALGIQHGDEAFEGLRRDGVIRAEFPEARRGDSGLQFWNFAHWTTQPTESG